MRDRGNDQLQALRATLGPKAGGTVPTLPTRCQATAILAG
jgi:hypothetical protein